MSKDKIERIKNIIDSFNPQIGGQVAKDLEKELEELIAPIPDILSEFQDHTEDSVREAIAVVAGRLFMKNNSESGLVPILKELSQDSNKWVRIKAQRALTGGKADAEKMSPLGNACMSLFLAKGTDKSKSELRLLANIVETAFKRKIMRRKKKVKGRIGEDLETSLLFYKIMYGAAPKEEWHYNIDYTSGWKGDELRLLRLRRINPMIASFAVWPGRACRTFLVGVYEHDMYDDFVIWTKEHNSPEEARKSIDLLEVGIDARYVEDTSWDKVVGWM